MKNLNINFDGSCWPNPHGIAGFGYIIRDGQFLIDSDSGEFGRGHGMSNNVAEFYALYRSLHGVSKLLDAGRFDGDSVVLTVRGDSEFVVKMMNKHYRPKKHNPGLYYPYYLQAVEEVRKLRNRKVVINFFHVPRANNQECDDLSKKHLEKSKITEGV